MVRSLQEAAVFPSLTLTLENEHNTWGCGSETTPVRVTKNGSQMSTQLTAVPPVRPCGFS